MMTPGGGRPPSLRKAPSSCAEDRTSGDSASMPSPVPFNPAMLMPGSKPPSRSPMGLPGMGGSGALPRGLSAGGAGMGHLGGAAEDPTAGDEPSSAAAAGDGSGGDGTLAPLATASRPTKRQPGRRPRSKQQSSLVASMSNAGLSDDDDGEVGSKGGAGDGAGGGGAGVGGAGEGGGGGAPTRMVPGRVGVAGGPASYPSPPPFGAAGSGTHMAVLGGYGGGDRRWGLFSVSGSGVTGHASWAAFQVDLVGPSLHMTTTDGTESLTVLPLAAYSFSRLVGVPDRVGCIQLEPDVTSAGGSKGSAWIRLPTASAPETQRSTDLDGYFAELCAAKTAAEAVVLANTQALLRSTLGEADAQAAMAAAMRDAQPHQQTYQQMHQQPPQPAHYGQPPSQQAPYGQPQQHPRGRQASAAGDLRVGMRVEYCSTNNEW